MSIRPCLAAEHGDAIIKTHYNEHGVLDHYEIVEIDDAPGVTLVVTPELIKDAVQQIDDLAAAVQRVRELADELDAESDYDEIAPSTAARRIHDALNGVQRCQRCGAILPSTDAQCGCIALDGSHE